MAVLLEMPEILLRNMLLVSPGPCRTASTVVFKLSSCVGWELACLLARRLQPGFSFGSGPARALARVPASLFLRAGFAAAPGPRADFHLALI